MNKYAEPRFPCDDKRKEVCSKFAADLNASFGLRCNKERSADPAAKVILQALL